MFNNKKIFLIFIMIYMLPFLIHGYDKETEKVMPFVSSSKYCFECHKKNEPGTRFSNTTLTCDDLCLKCHKLHHKTDIRVIGKSRKEFRLTDRKKIACFTCHDLSRNRYDKIPWKSESLFESVFSGKPKYKTYFLVYKNNNGELCKKCH